MLINKIRIIINLLYKSSRKPSLVTWHEVMWGIVFYLENSLSVCCELFLSWSLCCHVQRLQYWKRLESQTSNCRWWVLQKVFLTLKSEHSEQHDPLTCVLTVSGRLSLANNGWKPDTKHPQIFPTDRWVRSEIQFSISGYCIFNMVSLKWMD